jgi:hypothetical protein
MKQIPVGFAPVRPLLAVRSLAFWHLLPTLRSVWQPPAFPRSIPKDDALPGGRPPTFWCACSVLRKRGADQHRPGPICPSHVTFRPATPGTVRAWVTPWPSTSPNRNSPRCREGSRTEMASGQSTLTPAAPSFRRHGMFRWRADSISLVARPGGRMVRRPSDLPGSLRAECVRLQGFEPRESSCIHPLGVTPSGRSRSSPGFSPP